MSDRSYRSTIPWSGGGRAGRSDHNRQRPVIRGDGKRYETVAAAALDTGAKGANIHTACREGRTCKGFTWKYADD